MSFDTNMNSYYKSEASLLNNIAGFLFQMFQVPPSLMTELCRILFSGFESSNLTSGSLWGGLLHDRQEIFWSHICSSILIYIQTGNNDCCPQFVATHWVYFGSVPRVEKHEMDHRSLKQHPNVWGPLIVVTGVKTLSKHRRNVSRTDKPGCVNIEKGCRDWWAQSLQPSVWSPF